MHASVISSWLGRLAGLVALVVGLQSAARGDNLPIYRDVEFQPLSAQVKRVAEALEMLGEPLSRRREGAARRGDRFDGRRRARSARSSKSSTNAA